MLDITFYSESFIIKHLDIGCGDVSTPLSVQQM